MVKKSEASSFLNIFKSTALFAFVQVFRSIVGIVKNKIIAVLLGAEGIGIIGVYDSIILFIQTFAGLGLRQSAVKDIAEVNEKSSAFSRTISIVNKVVLFTAVIGGVITVVFSSFIGNWILGDGDHFYLFLLLAIVVFFNIINEGKLTVLKGMRRLRLLAYANIIGVLVAFITAVPFYYFFKEKGIIPVFLISAGVGMLISNWFVKKISYERIKLTIKEVFKEATPMMRMGIVLMFVTFLDTIVSLIIISYVRYEGGFIEVGLFNAGKVIISSYFGVLITALTTDYYPRISEINNNNAQLEIELNKQSLMSIVLLAPLFVFFLFLLPFFIEILYTKEFLPAVDYIKFGIYGTLITICSNQVDLILVAKQKVKVFTTISIVYRILQLLLSIYFYDLFGITGLGITIILTGIFHMLAMSITVKILYNIRFSKKFLKIALIVLIFALSSSYISSLDDDVLKYVLGFVISIFSCLFSIFLFKNIFNIDLFNFIKKKF